MTETLQKRKQNTVQNYVNKSEEDGNLKSLTNKEKMSNKINYIIQHLQLLIHINNLLFLNSFSDMKYIDGDEYLKKKKKNGLSQQVKFQAAEIYTKLINLPLIIDR